MAAVNVAGGGTQATSGDAVAGWLRNSWEAGLRWLRHGLKEVFGPPHGTASLGPRLATLTCESLGLDWLAPSSQPVYKRPPLLLAAEQLEKREMPAAAYFDTTVSSTQESTNATVTVKLNLPLFPGQSGTVDYASVSGGTATAGVDYTSVSGTLTFTSASSTQTFTIPINNDTLHENNETIALQLSNATGNLTIGSPSTMNFTITDNDSAPSVQFSSPNVIVGEGLNAVFSVSLSAASGLDTTVHYASSGSSATSGTDFSSTSGDVTIPAGSTTANVSVTTLQDYLNESDEQFTMSLSSPVNGSLGATTTSTATIYDDDVTFSGIPAPLVVSGGDCTCGGGMAVLASPFGVGPPAGAAPSQGAVSYGDGVKKISTVDLASDGFGQVWGQSRSWSSGSNFATGATNGTGWVDDQGLYLQQASGSNNDHLTLVTNAHGIIDFDRIGSTTYRARFGGVEQLSQDSGNNEFVLVDGAGNTIHFNDFSAGIASGARGQLKSFVDPNGNSITVTSRTSGGAPSEVQRSFTSGGVTTTESLVYTYNGSNLLTNVTLRRRVGSGSWATVRTVDYTYYSGESYGNTGDLKFAIVKDAGSNTLKTDYYRYYTTGFHGLKYAFEGAAYDRLAAAFSDPTTATDTQVAPYAQTYLEYDSTTHRVTKDVEQGAGESDVTYTDSSNANDPNSWTRKSVEDLADGNQNTVYSNYVGQTLLEVHKDTTTNDVWLTYFRYDADGRMVMKAYPSAVSGYSESYSDLLHNQSGNYQYLRDSTGLIETYVYGSSTTATSSTAGDVAGYLTDVRVQQGESGTPILQERTQYLSRSAGTTTIYVLASDTVYRNTDSSGGETTSFSYTWVSGTVQMESKTTTLPTVTTAQNGPNSADTSTVFFNSYAQPVWTKDGDGFLSYVDYDPITGGVTKTITDVNTSQTGDFTNLPSGWSTPSGGGGLHLITQYEVDSFGRPTKITDPASKVTYIRYDDVNLVTRVYPGWDATNHVPTGPTQVYRTDRAGSYTETLTMTATPALDGSNLPTGTETIANVQTLSRTYTNSAGQVIYDDNYFYLSGLTYSTSTSLGTENTNFYRTRYGYDNMGRPTRIQLPTGTIERVVYDSSGRALSTWMGTNDTPTSGDWSPSNNSSPANMVKISENQYDGGGVGDKNLTKVTQIPGGSAVNRVTQYYFDWRDRLVATKSGVEASEGTSVNRPITYQELDNLGEVTAQERYDGDNVSISDSNSDGVPDKPSSSLLRARQTTSYDEQGRVFRTQVYSVSPSDGSVSTYAITTDQGYDHRGNLIKTSEPGGLVTKGTFDGAGRQTKVYATDGGGDSGWSDADDVSGDKVLKQVEYTFDADGNVILTTTRQRFHDETGTGALVSPSTSPKARVSYVAQYYDAANRLTATVDYGTYGGSSFTRPSTPDSRSDTALVTSYTFTAAGWVETTTDPRGIGALNVYDSLGRVTRSIAAYYYPGDTPTNNQNGITDYTYDGDNHILTVTAVLPSSQHETTQYVYGVTTSGGSDVNSNDLLKEVRWPDKTTGNASTSDKESYTVNGLGENKTYTDRNGSVHTYSYDVVGRPTADAVTTLASGVNGAVRRLETAYDTAGNAYLFTSYDAASSGNVVNQVQDVFNGLGQLITEYQANSGAVNTGTTPKVQYAYSEMPSGANHSRLVSMTYPDGTELDYNYDSGLDSSISRLSSMQIGSTTVEQYAYLGLDTVVKRVHLDGTTEIGLTYIKQSGESNGDAGDQYTGLDRFDRVVDQRWIKSTDVANPLDRFKYAYDRDSNRLYKDNLLNNDFDELYHANGASAGYDNFNQLTHFRRGPLSDANSDGVPDTVTTASRTQNWDYDALGNWSTLTTDGTAQNRGHNQQNQITSITGLTTPTYDASGNMTGDENGKTLIYDAFNRLVEVKNGSTSLAAYAYDAKGQRIKETVEGRDFYYSDQWQVLEERLSGTTQVRYVWSPVYVDAMVLRDRDADASSGNGLEERLYAIQDANWNVTGVMTSSGTVQERYAYDPFGVASYLAANWSSLTSSSYGWVYLHEGGRFEGATGLYEFRNRDLSPALGRWTSDDPIGFEAGDSNLFRYVGNDPTSTFDPSGEAPVTKPKPSPPPTVPQPNPNPRPRPGQGSDSNPAVTTPPPGSGGIPKPMPEPATPVPGPPAQLYPLPPAQGLGPRARSVRGFLEACQREVQLSGPFHK